MYARESAMSQPNKAMWSNACACRVLWITPAHHPAGRSPWRVILQSEARFPVNLQSEARSPVNLQSGTRFPPSCAERSVVAGSSVDTPADVVGGCVSRRIFNRDPSPCDVDAPDYAQHDGVECDNSTSIFNE